MRCTPTSSDTLPCSGVNLNAFDNRFLMTCSSRCLSVFIIAGEFGPIFIAKFIFFCCARTVNICSISWVISFTATSSKNTSTLPASILDKSSISLISSSKSEPDLWMMAEYSICLSVRFLVLLSFSSAASISTLLSGVRSSCDIFARNSDLYLLLASSSVAFCDSSIRACSTASVFSSISTFICFSSSSWVRSSSSDALNISAWCVSSSLVWRSSSCWLSSSSFCSCTCPNNFVIRSLESAPFTAMAILSATAFSRGIYFSVVLLVQASSMTPFNSFFCQSGTHIRVSGTIPPAIEVIFQKSAGRSFTIIISF